MLNETEVTMNHHKLGTNLFINIDSDSSMSEGPAICDNGKAFLEVSIHPFIQQRADEDGEVEYGDWANASGGEFSDEYGDELEGYPDEMFRKGWSVSSWVSDPDSGDIEDFDDEEFPDYETAISRAQQLAAKYRVGIDHRY
jgi:hypothetical protein